MNLSKFCSLTLKKLHSKKKIDINAINKILKLINKGVAKIDKLDADNIKYVTCLKLKYPPNIFSSRLMS